MRRFYMARKEDETGVSGTGIVLQGVLTAAGRVFVEWRLPRASMGIYLSLDEFEEIHVKSHPAKTEIRWLD